MSEVQIIARDCRRLAEEVRLRLEEYAIANEEEPGKPGEEACTCECSPCSGCEWEACLCGARVPAGDTGLCLNCEVEQFGPELLIEAETPEEAVEGERPGGAKQEVSP